MDRLLNLQTALSLGYVASMVTLAHLSSLYILPSSSSRKTHLIYLWLAFDCICHLTLEGSFLYLSLQNRTVNTSSSFFGYLWQEYAAADARWGTADPTLVSMEWVTVLLAGPLAGWCAWLLGKGDRTYHYWVVVLSAGELYGGWMPFAPEWLTGSKGLEVGNWLLLWVYLVFMNVVWVVIPAWLMVDSYVVIAQVLRESTGFDGTVAPVKEGKKKVTSERGTMTKALTSPRGLSGSAYLLILTAIFLYIMPSASATSTIRLDPHPSSDFSILPIIPTYHPPSFWASIKTIITPYLIPLFLVTFSLFVGSLQIVDKALRQTLKSNRIRRRKLLTSLNIDPKSPDTTIIGFFHPYCNAGGGGERVLYEAISLHLSSDPHCVIVIYTGDYPGASKEAILTKASSRFGINIDSNRIAMIGLKRRYMVEDTTWKSFTLLGQSYGSIWLGFEALSQLIPDVWIDTMGYAFTYPVVRLFSRKIPIGAYVHYPVISTDMLSRVAKREAGHTNNSSTANSVIRSRVKLVYYRIFAKLYSWALKRADAVVGNGSWTQNHLNQLMGRREVEKVFPPCDTSAMSDFPLEGRRKRVIVSLAQFRPEKEHSTQLYILKQLFTTHPHLFSSGNSVKLVLVGSSRNESDESRIESLRKLARELEIEEHTEFVVNADYSVILERRTFRHQRCRVHGGRIDNGES